MKISSKFCNLACTRVLKWWKNREVSASVGVSDGVYKRIDGYRYLHIYVEFTQKNADEAPVDLGVMFAFDSKGTMGSRRYINLEENLSSPQGLNFISVSGEGSWHGSQTKVSRYMARFPVMGPYVQVFLYNRAPKKRKVSVWAYLVS
ncbi:MAG: hypothetical protein JSV33_07550 [bacterium]|nr:MAG: hypothetical protein JSV33_07550 [bacterium]